MKRWDCLHILHSFRPSKYGVISHCTCWILRGSIRAAKLIFKTSREYIYCTEMYEGLNERAGGRRQTHTDIISYKRHTKCTKMIMFVLGTGCSWCIRVFVICTFRHQEVQWLVGAVWIIYSQTCCNVQEKAEQINITWELGYL